MPCARCVCLRKTNVNIKNCAYIKPHAFLYYLNDLGVFFIYWLISPEENKWMKEKNKVETGMRADFRGVKTNKTIIG